MMKRFFFVSSTTKPVNNVDPPKRRKTQTLKNYSLLRLYLRIPRRNNLKEVLTSRVNSVDQSGKTPLHIAAESKNMHLVRMMLDFFSNVDACDDMGNTVLHAVVDEKSGEDDLCLEIVKILLAKGADPIKKQKFAMTPVELSLRRCNIEFLKIFKDYGVDFTVITDRNENWLLLAFKNYFFNYDNPSMVKIIDFLIDQGCDVNMQESCEGNSPLHIAAKKNMGLSVIRLIELGADVNRQTKMLNRTPLHIAIDSWAFDNVIKALWCAGAYSNAVDFRGVTPLDLALENEDLNSRILERILDYGGDINNVKTIFRWWMGCREGRRIVIRHADKLMTVGFPIHAKYRRYMKRKSMKLEYHDDYVNEVEKLKSYVINEGVSVYQFLHMNWRRQLAYVQFLPEDLELQFPLYANFILTVRNEAVRRNQLLEPAKIAWFQITKTNLPDVCLERILYFLGNWQLKILIDANEVTDAGN